MGAWKPRAFRKPKGALAVAYRLSAPFRDESTRPDTAVMGLTPSVVQGWGTSAAGRPPYPNGPTSERRARRAPGGPPSRRRPARRAGPARERRRRAAQDAAAAFGGVGVRAGEGGEGGVVQDVTGRGHGLGGAHVAAPSSIRTLPRAWPSSTSPSTSPACSSRYVRVTPSPVSSTTPATSLPSTERGRAHRSGRGPVARALLPVDGVHTRRAHRDEHLGGPGTGPVHVDERLGLRAAVPREDVRLRHGFHSPSLPPDR